MKNKLLLLYYYSENKYNNLFFYYLYTIYLNDTKRSVKSYIINKIIVSFLNNI